MQIGLGDAAVVERLDVVDLLRRERERAGLELRDDMPVEDLAKAPAREPFREPLPQVGGVRLIGVQEQEEALVAMGFEPAARLRERRLHSPAFLDELTEALVESEVGRDEAAFGESPNRFENRDVEILYR